MSAQVDIVSKIKSANPSLAEKPGKDMFLKYIANKRNMALDLDGKQQYQVYFALTVLAVASFVCV